MNKRSPCVGTPRPPAPPGCTGQEVRLSLLGGPQEDRSPPLTGTPSRKGQLAASALRVNYISHQPPVPTFHFWIAGFPLRTETISL